MKPTLKMIKENEFGAIVIYEQLYPKYVPLSLKRGDPRFILHTYVCDGPCIRPSTGEGTLTFTQVFVNRPDGCRYAIIQPVSGVDEYLVVDLYETTYDDTSVYMGPRLTFSSLDGAIAARMLNYDRL
tara:strand:+ start:1273 stop:1653 length:381 start_codon:yes stop_codon:yes gene_type:complete